MPALAIRDDIAPEELRRRERDGRVSARLISLAGRPPEGLVLDGREYGGKLNCSGRKTVPAPVSDFPLPVPYIPTDAGKRKLNRHSPGSVNFGARIAPLSGSGYGKSPSSRAEVMEADG